MVIAHNCTRHDVGPGALWERKFPTQSRSSAGTGALAPHPPGAGAACSRSNVAVLLPVSTGASILLAETEETSMSNKRHHQRRRRRFKRVWLFELITFLGQAAFYAVRIWFWFWDRR